MNDSQNIIILKTIAIFGMLGPCVFFILITILSYLWIDYDPLVQVFSALGAEGAPQAIIMNFFGFGFLGICIILFSIGLLKGVNKHLFKSFSVILLISSGILIFLLIFFPCDIRCAHTTILSQFHRIFTYIVSFFIPIAIIFLTYPLKLDKKWRYAWLYFPLELIVFFLIVLSLIFIPEFYKFIGLMQRISMAVVLFWMLIMSIHLYHLIRKGKIL